MPIRSSPKSHQLQSNAADFGFGPAQPTQASPRYGVNRSPAPPGKDRNDFRRRGAAGPGQRNVNFAAPHPPVRRPSPVDLDPITTGVEDEYYPIEKYSKPAASKSPRFGVGVVPSAAGGPADHEGGLPGERYLSLAARVKEMELLYNMESKLQEFSAKQNQGEIHRSLDRWKNKMEAGANRMFLENKSRDKELSLISDDLNHAQAQIRQVMAVMKEKESEDKAPRLQELEAGLREVNKQQLQILGSLGAEMKQGEQLSIQRDELRMNQLNQQMSAQIKSLHDRHEMLERSLALKLDAFSQKMAIEDKQRDSDKLTVFSTVKEQYSTLAATMEAALGRLTGRLLRAEESVRDMEDKEREGEVEQEMEARIAHIESVSAFHRNAGENMRLHVADIASQLKQDIKGLQLRLNRIDAGRARRPLSAASATDVRMTTKGVDQIEQRMKALMRENPKGAERKAKLKKLNADISILLEKARAQLKQDAQDTKKTGVSNGDMEKLFWDAQKRLTEAEGKASAKDNEVVRGLERKVASQAAHIQALEDKIESVVLGIRVQTESRRKAELEQLSSLTYRLDQMELRMSHVQKAVSVSAIAGQQGLPSTSFGNGNAAILNTSQGSTFDEMPVGAAAKQTSEEDRGLESQERQKPARAKKPSKPQAGDPKPSPRKPLVGRKPVRKMNDDDVGRAIVEQKKTIQTKASAKSNATLKRAPAAQEKMQDDIEKEMKKLREAEIRHKTESKGRGGLAYPKFSLQISCSNLPGHAHKSDPIAVVYYKEGDAEFAVVDKTEKVPHQHNPIFEHVIALPQPSGPDGEVNVVIFNALDKDEVDPDDTLGFSIFPFSRLAVNQENHELLTLPLYEIAEEGQPPKEVFDSYGKASTVSIKISAARTAD